MRERPADDTTKEPARAPREGGREREPGGYYYDDGTGYEIYDPSADEPNEEPSEGEGTEEL